MARDWTDRILIQDLKLKMSIGIYERERKAAQTVLATIHLDVESNQSRPLVKVSEIVSYEEVIRDIQTLAASKHYELAERLAEDIASLCLNDKRVRVAEIKVVKTEIMTETTGVGVQIRRTRHDQA